jgi:hypothetical protein
LSVKVILFITSAIKYENLAREVIPESIFVFQKDSRRVTLAGMTHVMVFFAGVIIDLKGGA